MASFKIYIHFLRNLVGLSFVFCLLINTTIAQPNLKPGKYQYTIVSLAGKGFGYHIKQNNKIFIKQEHIPAIQGVKAFASKIDAEKCAKLVVKKLSKAGNLPSLTKEELVQLHIKI